MKSFFINEAFDKAVTDYLSSKSKEESILYNSFLVVVIRALVVIYGELDILNPFQTKNEIAIDSNFMRFGATIEEISNLKRAMTGFYLIDKKNEESMERDYNPYFIEVQKCLVNLFYCKKMNYGITAAESHELFDLLYTPGTSNPLRLSYNYLNAKNEYEVAEYFKNLMSTQKEEVKEKKNLLGFDVYKLFNVSIADLSKMDSEEVEDLNSEIYKSFDIQENAINKKYLLKERVKELNIQRTPLTTGNGYVDILLIMSLVVTAVMVAVIFGTIVI